MYERTETNPSRPSSPERKPEVPLTRANQRIIIEPLMTAAEVASVLVVNTKRVYELGIPSIRLSNRTIRWRPSDVKEYIDERRAES